MKDSCDLSVIIPCYGRTQTLKPLLRALKAQSLDLGRFEVILVDDGNQPELSENLSDEELDQVRLVRQENAGPAKARNTAMKHARGRLALFLNSDAVPSATLVEQHLDRHAAASSPVAVLGRFDSTPNCQSAFQIICERAGCIFPYRLARVGEPLPGWFFWTCNVSVPLDAVLQAGGFDPAFRKPAGDDVEMGHRLASSGVPVYFVPEIECGHDHVFDLDTLKARQFMLGYEWVRIVRKHPAAAMAGEFGLSVPADGSFSGTMNEWLEKNRDKEQPTCEQITGLLSRIQAVDQDSETAALLIDQVQRLATFHWVRGVTEAFRSGK